VGQELGEILARNLNAQVPASLQAMLEQDERALVVFPSPFGAIVATDRRVLVGRLNQPAVVLGFSQLTGAAVHLGLFSRYLMLTGPEFPEKVGFGKAATVPNATLVQVWQRGEAKRAAAEITRLVVAANQIAAHGSSKATG
jgi:hypothetical protein